jgi:hypothetical protein
VIDVSFGRVHKDNPPRFYTWRDVGTQIRTVSVWFGIQHRKMVGIRIQIGPMSKLHKVY